MQQKHLIYHHKHSFYKIWLLVCSVILATAIANSILVYIQVSRELNRTIRQRLEWEAHFYGQQLDQVFIRTGEKLNSLVQSSAADSANRQLLQNEMENIFNASHSIIHIWVAYPNGKVIPSSHTRSDYICNLPWWREYLSGVTPRALNGLWVGQGQSLIGKPFMDQSDVTAIVPLFSLKLHGVNIVRAVGAQLDLNSALIDDSNINSNLANIHVSIYTLDGVLVACPDRYQRGNLQLLAQPSRHPLIRLMLAHPNEISEFKTYAIEGRKNVGLYLRNPNLGLVLTVEYPASKVLDPISRITIGPLIVTVSLLLITTIVLSMIYSNAKRLTQMEHLARSAELRALQAHINPHFLFNTLDRMVSMAVSTENTGLLTMLKSLAHILRYTTCKMEALVTLNEELSYLQEYIVLQQVRFGSRFSFHLDAAPEWLDYHVYKLSIQPLIENCFTHGVEKSLDPVAISLSISRKTDTLEICVADNGPGITPERLQEINQLLEQEKYEADRNHGLGLANIHLRYRYAFGKGYGIRIQPAEPGLTIYLTIPLL
jgi:signal transduction histidine kinase